MRRNFTLDLFFCVLAVCPLVAQTGAPSGAQTSIQPGTPSNAQATGSTSNRPASPGGISSAPGYDTLIQAPSGIVSNPLTQPTLSPGVLHLLELDGRLSQAVASGGGKAFSSWFTEDAVTLNNGRPAVYGHGAITAEAQWDPKVYQLTWTPQGAQMGPSNDMGFTWGHYQGHAKDKNGEPVVIEGRYITVWKKLPGDDWKIALEASANDTPAAGDCCALPKP